MTSSPLKKTTLICAILLAHTLATTLSAQAASKPPNLTFCEQQFQLSNPDKRLAVYDNGKVYLVRNRVPTFWGNVYIEQNGVKTLLIDINAWSFRKPSKVLAATLSDDKSTLYLYSDNSTQRNPRVTGWDVVTGRNVLHLKGRSFFGQSRPNFVRGPISSHLISPDQKTWTLSGEHQTHFMQLKPNAEHGLHLSNARILSYSKDSNVALVAYDARDALGHLTHIVEMRDARNGGQVGTPLMSNHPAVRAEFSPDNKYILVLETSGLARLWDVQALMLSIYQAYGNPIYFPFNNMFIRDAHFGTDSSVIQLKNDDGSLTEIESSKFVPRFFFDLAIAKRLKTEAKVKVRITLRRPNSLQSEQVIKKAFSKLPEGHFGFERTPIDDFHFETEINEHVFFVLVRLNSAIEKMELIDPAL